MTTQFIFLVMRITTLSCGKCNILLYEEPMLVLFLPLIYPNYDSHIQTIACFGLVLLDSKFPSKFVGTFHKAVSHNKVWNFKLCSFLHIYFISPLLIPSASSPWSTYKILLSIHLILSQKDTSIFIQELTDDMKLISNIVYNSSTSQK